MNSNHLKRQSLHARLLEQIMVCIYPKCNSKLPLCNCRKDFNMTDAKRFNLKCDDASILKLGEQRALELLGNEIGLIVTKIGNKSYYTADDIHRMLGNGQGYIFPEVKPTHAGLLIGVKPIVQQTREQKLENSLKELMDIVQGAYGSCSQLDCAKALLEKP